VNWHSFPEEIPEVPFVGFRFKYSSTLLVKHHIGINCYDYKTCKYLVDRENLKADGFYEETNEIVSNVIKWAYPSELED